MEQFAAIRLLARSLRAEAAVADTETAIEVARQAAKHLALKIRALPADDIELEGAHGLLDRQFKTILVRNELPEPVLAEVLAHEIGHFKIHDGPERGYYPRSEANGGDPGQRIETYGIKERREAQANVFSRELVLPRYLAKSLFMGGKPASRISLDLNVRDETTLQQLADGLLLPDVTPVEAKERPVPPCDDSQNRTIAHRGRPALVRAGPGTGKTKTLTARIVSLIEDDVPPANILALTFSNRAALELSERVQLVVGSKAVNVWTGTFHAFGLDTIRKHHALFGVSEDPRIVDASESVAMLEEALPALEMKRFLNLLEPALALRDILRAISRAKDELWSWEDYQRAAAAMGASARSEDERVAAEKAGEVAVVYEHYQKQLIADGAVDYGDLIMRPTMMMRGDRDFRDAMRSKFTHVHMRSEAASKALPCAIQVADRWHLMENASAAFLSPVRKSMRPIRAAIGATTINPELLTCAERLQYEGYLRREETIATILALAKDGAAIKQIVRKTGHSRNRVRQVLRGDRGDVFRTRQSSLDAHLPLLDAQWAGGCRNGAKLWRRLKSDGFRGSQRVVSEWATRRRRAEKASDRQLQKVPSARTIARLMTSARDYMSKADTVTIAAIEAGVPTLVAAQTLTDRFHTMIRKRTEADLFPWIAAASESLLASFASGVTKDVAAVHAALVQPWSNGQTEGQITKLKLVKRQMYGRAKIDLLQARLIGAT